MRKIRICFAASSGGHYEQIMMLEPLMRKVDPIIVTEKTKYSMPVDGITTYYVRQVNRKEKTFLFSLIVNLFISIRIMILHKPDVVICTGALAMIPLCLLTKILNRKLIYIESYAKVTSASKSGELMYRFADRFYVQWEPLKQRFPKAIMCGGIY